MHRETGQLYTPEELEKMHERQLLELVRITEQEHRELSKVAPQRRSSTLDKMRGHLPPER